MSRSDLAPQDVRDVHVSTSSHRLLKAPLKSCQPVSSGAVPEDVRMSPAKRRCAGAGVRTLARANARSHSSLLDSSGTEGQSSRVSPRDRREAAGARRSWAAAGSRAAGLASHQQGRPAWAYRAVWWAAAGGRAAALASHQINRAGGGCLMSMHRTVETDRLGLFLRAQVSVVEKIRS